MMAFTISTPPKLTQYFGHNEMPAELPIIVRVFGDGASTDVPVTPETTCSDVIECCRDPGEESCDLVAVCPDKGECALRETDHPLEILQRWGSGRLILRYTVLSTNGGTYEKRNGMKEPENCNETLPADDVQLTLNELQDMACRQQAQIDTQHQLLAAKEQRLRYLKEQEARQQRVQAESERLRRLRDRVDAQELKLRKLRAIRGQVDHQKQNNISLTSDLDSIRALFNEKEKELSMAVAKVEELTRQLEELRRGRTSREPTPASALELDKLRRELMYRNKLNEQQNLRLSQQREALTARQEEMSAIDKRISELQERLHRKRMLNQQLANQINATSHKAAYHQLVRLTSGSTDQTYCPNTRKPIPLVQNNMSHHHLSNNPHLHHPMSHMSQQNGTGPMLGSGGNGSCMPLIPRNNIAAVEPFNHVPAPQPRNPNLDLQQQQQQHQQQQHHSPNLNKPKQQQYNNNHNTYQQQQDDQQKMTQGMYGSPNGLQQLQQSVDNDAEDYKQQQQQQQQQLSKSDPKYQTLPYNTKFTVNLLSGTVKQPTGDGSQYLLMTSPQQAGQGKDSVDLNGNKPKNIMAITSAMHLRDQLEVNTTPSGNQVLQGGKLMVSSPSATNVVNSNTGDISQNKLSTGRLAASSDSGLLQCAIVSTSNNGGSPSYHPQKPITSIPPTSVQHTTTGKLSTIYQTSSTKVQPVEPQTIHTSVSTSSSITGTHTNITTNTDSKLLSPKPALPPKPSPSNATSMIKPPPRQTGLSQQHVSAAVEAFEMVNGELPPCPPPPPPLSQPPASDDDKSSAPTLPTTLANMLTNAKDTITTTSTAATVAPPPSSSISVIKAKPLTIRKQHLSEQPKLRTSVTSGNSGTSSSTSRLNGLLQAQHNSRKLIEIQTAIANSTPPSLLPPPTSSSSINSPDTEQLHDIKSPSTGSNEDNSSVTSSENNSSNNGTPPTNGVRMRLNVKKTNLKQQQSKQVYSSRRVSFDPLALLLDASLEGELELVKKTATQVANPSAANDEGITALHNAICAGHLEIVRFLVEFGCDVNAQDSDGWTPLHCAASCNNVAMVRFLVEHGACIFATTLSDHETAAEKCEEDEEGFDGCSEYLYSVQEKLGILSNGAVYSVFDYSAQQPDELGFQAGQQLTVLRKGDENEREWWWCRLDDTEGYVPRNLLGLYPRVIPSGEDVCY